MEVIDRKSAGGAVLNGLNRVAENTENISKLGPRVRSNHRKRREKYPALAEHPFEYCVN